MLSANLAVDALFPGKYEFLNRFDHVTAQLNEDATKIYSSPDVRRKLSKLGLALGSLLATVILVACMGSADPCEFSVAKPEHMQVLWNAYVSAQNGDYANASQNYDGKRLTIQDTPFYAGDDKIGYGVYQGSNGEYVHYDITCEDGTTSTRHIGVETLTGFYQSASGN